MTKVHPKVEEAVETLGLNALTRRRLLVRRRPGQRLARRDRAARRVLGRAAMRTRSRTGSSSAAVGELPEDAEVEVRLRLPRHDQPVLHPDPVRRRGRLRAARLLVPVDRVEGLGRGRDGQRHEHRDHRQGRRHRASPSWTRRRSKVRSTRPWTPGFPVVSYNADGARDDPGTNRLAYIGQGLYESGYAAGPASAGPDRLAATSSASSPRRASSTSSRGSTAPRHAIKDSGKPIKFTAVATNADITKGLSIIDAYAQGHQDVAGHVRGRRRLDPGRRHGRWRSTTCASKGLKVAGGFDLIPETLNSIKAGDLDYTIDQQPYLQGFLPVLALYLYKLVRRAAVPPQTNTGLLFVTKDNVDPYLATKTRYEGSDTAPEAGHRGPGRSRTRDDMDRIGQAGGLPDPVVRVAIGHSVATIGPPSERVGAVSDVGVERPVRQEAPPPHGSTLAAAVSTVRDAFLQRREASVLLVALALLVYFRASSRTFPDPRQPGEHRPGHRAGRDRRGGHRAAAGQRGDRPVGRHGVRARAVPHALLGRLLRRPGDPGDPAGAAGAARRSARSTALVTVMLRVPSFVATLGTFYAAPGHHADDLPRLPGGDPARRRRANPAWLGAARLVRADLVPGDRRGLPHRADPDPVGTAHGRRSAATCSARPRRASRSPASRSATS